MKKPKLLFAAAALLCGGLSANAQGWTASAPATGDFYLYNVGANAYLENGSSWGTHAALKSSGFVVNITAGDGVYTIGTNSKYAGKFFTDNGYVDTGSSSNWIFEPVAGMTNTYKLKTASGSYAYAAAGMYNLELGADPGTNKGYWKLVTAANRDDVTGASATNPIELTHKINNPRFDEYESRNNKNYVKGWPNDIAWGGNTSGTNNDVPSWDDRNPCGEFYNCTYDTYQELTGLSNGVYAISVQGFYREGGFAAAAPKHVDGTESLNAILYANGGGEDATEPLMSIFEEAGKASGGGTATATGIDGIFPNNMSAASYFFSAGLYWNTVYVEVTNGTLKFGVKKSTTVGADWTIFDNFRLQYFGNCTINEAKFGALVATLNEAVTAAQGFIDSNPTLSTEQIAALQKIINDNDNDDNAFTEESQYTTAIETINNAATTYAAMVAPYATFIALKANADAIAAVAYTETTSGSHTTFTGAITTQAAAADEATTAEAIVTATNDLKAAIKTYIAGAEPKNDGEYFDITCLVANPDFANNDIEGWTRTNSTGGNAQTTNFCNEFWNNTFDFYQDLTELPNGSYQLSVQAFCRPGDNGNLTDNKKAYYDYTQGVNNVHAELYVNDDASKVGNIYAYKDATTAKFNIPGDWSSDYECVVDGGTNYFVPNSMAGAHQYFLDENVYKTEVAALVNSGSLRIGFRDETLTAAQWTIFTNFRLHYYGSSKMIYYKQYLPQLEAEITADYLNNAAYAVLKDGQTERAALVTANSADANTLTTEQQFEDAIKAITDARDAFVKAKGYYDKLAEGLASSAYYVGDGVFQMSSENKANFDAALAAGQTMYTTGTASAMQVGAQILAISKAYVLNAPDASKRYKLTLSGKGALTFKKGGAADEGGYENPFMEANDNLAQHFTLTKVNTILNPNVYTLSFVDLDGNTRYICVGEKAKEGLGNEKIRTTTVAADALQIIILGTTTQDVFNMVNSVTESKLGSNGGGLYTTNDATNFTIAEAAKAKVNVKIDADVKYGTRIFPFTPTLPTGVVAYTCTVEGNALNLAAVETPAADTPYVLFAESGVTGTDLEDWGLAAALTKEGGSLVGVYAAQKAPAGSYVLQNNDNKVGFYKVADGEGQQPTVGANRCYLTDPVSARPAYFFDGETTAIEALDALTSGDAEFFNAAGARIPALQKGVNIVRRADGTSYKVIVK